MSLAIVFCGLIFARFLTPVSYAQYFTDGIRSHLYAGTITNVISALMVLMAQVGLMGDGWQDVAVTQTWFAVLGTDFGQAWKWQIILGALNCFFCGKTTEKSHFILLTLTTLQLIGLAFIGHTLMHEGAAGFAQKLTQIIHLMSAGYWVGGVVMIIKVMNDSKMKEMKAGAISSMIKFSQYGHLAVSLVILSGFANTFFIRGWSLHSFSLYTQLLFAKVAIVALMVAMALVNRYCLVPRFKTSHKNVQNKFIFLTYAELALSLVVVCLVCVFSTLNPL